MLLKSVSGLDCVRIVISAFNVTQVCLRYGWCKNGHQYILMSLRSVSGMDGVRIVISAFNVIQVCLWYGWCKNCHQ